VALGGCSQGRANLHPSGGTRSEAALGGEWRVVDYGFVGDAIGKMILPAGIACCLRSVDAAAIPSCRSDFDSKEFDILECNKVAGASRADRSENFEAFQQKINSNTEFTDGSSRSC
jgi:hypothetical protein